MANLPKHVAIIMDGNGRWAALRGRPRVFGHIRGAGVVRAIVKSAYELGVASLTLFAFSTENWFRPQDEVNFLMKLLERHIRRQKKSLIEQNIRFSTIGNLSALPLALQREIKETMRATAGNSGMHLIFAMNYGARSELVSAVQKIAQLVEQGSLEPSQISESVIAQQLDTSNFSDPDLIIRTSGEMRLSNFLLWQSAYSELYFSDKFWPDFTESDLLKAFADFAGRKRRYGRVENKTGDDSVVSLINER